MRPLFKNLISNALLNQHTNVTPVITIRSEMRAGIDDENDNEGEKFCEIFVEAHQSFSVEKNVEFIDTRLGLAFCQKIMEHHKGRISAKSQVNEGLTYIISLPVEIEKGLNISLTETNTLKQNGTATQL